MTGTTPYNLQEWFEKEFLPNIISPPCWAQALNVAGEAGEFAESYRRFSGNARRGETMQDMMHELADVIISAYGFAALFDQMHGSGIGLPAIKLDDFITSKITIITQRGYGAQATPVNQSHGSTLYSTVSNKVHRYLPEQCDFWPNCDKPHAGSESLDSFPS